MRAVAMSVWIFINLLCFGMCGYLYLIWSKYWMYIEKQRYLNRPTVDTERSPSFRFQESFYPEYEHKPEQFNSSNLETRKSRRAAVGTYWSSSKLLQTVKSTSSQTHQSHNIVRKFHGAPRFPNVQPILEFDSEKYKCDDYDTEECDIKTAEFKELLLKEFHRVLMDEGKVFKSGLDLHNTYNVQYEGLSGRDRSRLEILCSLKNVPVKTVTADDEPFKTLGFHIPRGGLQHGRAYNACAVVTSAGALLGSRLGKFVDSHDMVLRFNNAPVENYTEDVGSKTTYRILNSQVMSKPEYKFLEDQMYSNVSIIVWDPANYKSSLEDWYRHPDYPLFPVYKKLLEQRKGADAHLLRPEVLWKLWAVLQDSSPYRLRRNPPSSGFIGLWFSLQRCQRVRMFEYVPSARATRRCHYHRTTDDPSCTLGAWHPLAQEKALAERMRDNSDLDVFQRGFIDVPGVTNLKCD